MLQSAPVCIRSHGLLQLLIHLRVWGGGCIFLVSGFVVGLLFFFSLIGLPNVIFRAEVLHVDWLSSLTRIKGQLVQSSVIKVVDFCFFKKA